MKAVVISLALIAILALASAAEELTCPTTSDCKACTAVVGCGLCTAASSSPTVSTATCGNLTATLSADFKATCTREGGQITEKAELCSAAVASPVVKAPAVTSVDCNSKATCEGCQADAACTYCAYSFNGAIGGSCVAKEGAQAYCDSKPLGQLACTPKTQEPTSASPVAVECWKYTTCDTCTVQAGCGFCRAGENGYCKAVTNETEFKTYCDAKAGTIIAPGTCPTEPAVPTICLDKDCASCTADSRCGFCSGEYTSKEGVKIPWGVCRALTESSPTFPEFCSAKSGSVNTVCGVPVKPTEPTGETTDTVCKIISTCGTCFDNAKCGLCQFKNASTVCRAKELTLNGEIGKVFCDRLGGTFLGERPIAVDVCKASTVADTINNGTINEAQINTDIIASKPQPLSNIIIVVTIITQAASTPEGKAQFEAFLDIDSPSELDDSQKTAICDMISTSVSTRLSVDRSAIACKLDKRTTVKRAAEAYTATMTVGGSSNSIKGSASSVVASVALLAAVLVKLF